MHFHPDVIASFGNTPLLKLRPAQTKWRPSARRLSRLVGLVLVTLLPGLAAAEPPAPQSPPGSTASGSRPSVCDNLSAQPLQGYKVPGRKPDSQLPWELFLGNASHRLIAYIYGTRYPTNVVYYNNYNIKRILREQRLGDWSLLSESERDMRPDITDVSAREVFEIKSYNEKDSMRAARKFKPTSSH